MRRPIDHLRGAAKTPRLRLLSVVIVLFFPAYWLVLRTDLNEPKATLPPPLRMLLPHIRKPTYPPSRTFDWKKPLVIAAHGEPDGDNVLVRLFVVGVDMQSFGRKFNVLGCLFGKHYAPVTNITAAIVTCKTAPELLQAGDDVSVVLEVNEALWGALAGSGNLGGETVRLTREDVRVKIVDKVGKAGVVRTLVKWKKEFVEDWTFTKPHYRHCMMTAMKQYPYLMPEWIQYYRAMGVDRFYIYENNAGEPLSKLVDSRYVEVVPWPFERSQLQSTNHFLFAGRSRCRYVSFFDADEYVLLPKNVTLADYMEHRSNQGYSQVAFLHLNMVNRGYVKKPQGVIPRLYENRERDGKVGLGKVVADMKDTWIEHRIHKVQGSSRTYWNTTMELNPTDVDSNSMLVHYSKRSWEEYVLKNKVGGASVLTRGRPKVQIDPKKVDPDYVNADGKNSVPFNTLRERYDDAIRVGNNMVRLEWNDETVGRTCVEEWCAGCVASFSTTTCTG